MKMSTTLVMLALFVVVLAVFAVLEWTGQPTAEQLRERKDRVLPQLAALEKEQVTRVELEYKADEKAKPIVFERTSADRWQMKAPIDVLADSGNVDSIISDLKSLKRKERTQIIMDTGGKPLTLSEYGLDKPKIVVTLTDKAGQKTRLAVGDKTATEDGVYVMDMNETPAVVQVVDKYGLSSFQEKKLADFREKKLVQTSKWDADRFAVRYDARKVDLAGEKKEGKWRLLRPVADNGDTSKIEDNVLTRIVDLKVADDKDFVDDAPKDLKPYGLDQPQATLEIGREKDVEGKKTTIVEKVLVGQALPTDKDKVYARIDGQNYVVAIKAEILTQMADVKVADLRDKVVVSLDKDKVDRVEIARASGEPLVLERFYEEKKKAEKDESDKTSPEKEIRWRITKPQTYDADKAAVDDLVTKFNDLKAADFIDGKPDKDYGLEPAELKVVFREGRYLSSTSSSTADEADTSIQKTRTLVLGRYDAQKKQRYLKRDPQAQTILLVDVSEDFETKLASGVLAYRDRKILEFDSAKVAKVSVQRDQKTFLMEKQKDKDGNDKWMLVEPVKAPGDSSIGTLVSTLASLSAEKLVTEDPKQFDQYGVGDQPRARATITLQKEAEDKPALQHVILLGRPVKAGDDASNAYARVSGQNLVFELSSWKARDFLAEFRDTKMFEFEDSKLKRLTVRWPRAQLIVDKDGDKYKLVEPKDVPRFDEQKVKDLVSEMRWLRADRYVQYAGPAQPAWGLDHPRLVVELALTDGKTHTVRFGAKSPTDKDRCYGAVSDFEPTPILSETFFKDMIEKGLRHFQKEEAATQPTATQPSATQPTATQPAGQ